MLIYVASPYSGDVETNVKNARRYCRFVVDSGEIPLAPHLLLPQFMDEEAERERALNMNKELLHRCDELWVFGNVITAGIAKEIKWANKEKKKVRFFGAVNCEPASQRYQNGSRGVYATDTPFEGLNKEDV